MAFLHYNCCANQLAKHSVKSKFKAFRSISVIFLLALRFAITN